MKIKALKIVLMVLFVGVILWIVNYGSDSTALTEETAKQTEKIKALQVENKKLLAKVLALKNESNALKIRIYTFENSIKKKQNSLTQKK